jgi:glycosyltransferase involved in cell wall biosynthesis
MVEAYLDRCIQSIVDQTYSNLEIILVDDGSPDRCPQICDEWSLRDSRIKVIHQENAGVSAARNTGIAMARGEYLSFVDSDDWIVSSLYEKVMSVFAENKVDIVVFNCDQITEAGKCLGVTEKMRDGILSQKEALQNLMQGNINSYLCNKVFTSETFDNIHIPNRTAFEDMAVTYKLFLRVDTIYCLNEPLYFYARRSGSASVSMNARKLGELYLSRQECYENLKPLYPEIAEYAFPYQALAALRLYDRCLWEPGDATVYAEAMAFLKENKDKILQTNRSIAFQLYYSVPEVYKLLRLGKHRIGQILRKIRK